jgi:hypothetical protein
MNKAAYELSGRYMLRAIRPDGSERIVADWFDNLVLDNGLNRIGTEGIASTAVIGSGNSAPTNGQSTLVTLVGATTNTPFADVKGTDLANGFAYVRRTFRFAAGVAAGNLAEVGIGWASNNLFSRALIRDGGGTPTTVTVLSDEVLDVVYELRVYWPTTDNVTTVNIGGTDYTVTVRASDVDQWANGTSMFALLLGNGLGDSLQDVLGYGPGSLGAVTEGPGGSFLNRPGTYGFDGSYVNNSNERKYKLIAGLSDITTDIGSFNVVTPLGMFKMGFSPSLPKTSSNILTINFKLAWARKVI